MTEKWRIVVGADEAGVRYKDALKADLEADPRVAEVIDVGVSLDENTAYPHVAVTAARKITDGLADRALLVCGTGLGVAISANKVPGIRAALCTDKETAAGARKWNDANVLALSLRTTSPALLEEILAAWFDAAPSPDADDRANVDHLAEIES